jgi:3D (Asp-Asp-Asp) domain-containing protein
MRYFKYVFGAYLVVGGLLAIFSLTIPLWYHPSRQESPRYARMIPIATVKATAYRSVPWQTKPKGFHWTASGERCNVHGCAASQDLLKKNGGPLSFGDLVYIDQIGFKFVNDVMNVRHKNRADIWVTTHEEEKKFDKKFKNSTLKIYLVKEN